MAPLPTTRQYSYMGHTRGIESGRLPNPLFGQEEFKRTFVKEQEASSVTTSEYCPLDWEARF